MRIVDLKCAMIGRYPIVRIVSDSGLSGYASAEHFKPYLKPYVLALRDAVVGEDPTDIERLMIRLRPRGAFKPYGAAVSVIEIALWDLAGKAAGLPVHKLLGGKVRERVRVYNGAMRQRMTAFTPEAYAAEARRMRDLPQRFGLVKLTTAFHCGMKAEPGFLFGGTIPLPYHAWIDRGPMTERGLKLAVDCAFAAKEALGDGIGLALDCGPGFMLADAIRFARAVEPLNLAWLEDMLTGDYTPYVNADVYRELTQATATPIHTGEQIYLRQNFKELFERKAVRIVGPDPCDVGGLAELKWVAEYADLHGVMIAPHGTGNGLLGLAALAQVCATLPQNFIAFELPWPEEPWWFDIVEGLPDPIVQDGHVAVPERPGMGADLISEKAKAYLTDEDRGFFD